MFRLSKTEAKEEHLLPPAGVSFDVKIETDPKQAYRHIVAALQVYRDEKKGPTLIAVQSNRGILHFAYRFFILLNNSVNSKISKILDDCVY